MRRFVIILALALSMVSAAHAAKPIYSCEVTQHPDFSTPELLDFHLAGTVPMKTAAYLRIDGSQEWTGLHNQKGVIDDWFSRTPAEVPPGTHTAEIVDLAKSDLGVGFVYVVSSCTFTVT